MPPEVEEGSAAERPLAVRFEDLFDHVGTFDVRYGAAVRELSGRDVVIEGYLARAHGPHRPLSLVDQQGVCPDCSPVAAISLIGALRPCGQGTMVPFAYAGASTMASASTTGRPRCSASKTQPCSW